MTIYYYLPVYKASYDLLIEIFRLTKNFTREYKYTIGESLKKEIIEMITNIYRANSRYAKKDLIQKARENVERKLVSILPTYSRVNVLTLTEEEVRRWIDQSVQNAKCKVQNQQVREIIGVWYSR